MPPLTGKSRRHLRALGHHLTPVVTVGQGGPSPKVLDQVDVQLKAHELIKIKVLEGTRTEMKNLAEALGVGTQSEVAQVLGRTILLYRAHPDRPRITLPD